MVERYRQASATVLQDVDVLVTPTCPMVAPAIGTVTVSMGGREEASPTGPWETAWPQVRPDGLDNLVRFF
jgi:Asp-tRNA(Asn)/Glu-tRNA(Gln) amidotransferase A subunit family amidase